MHRSLSLSFSLSLYINLSICTSIYLYLYLSHSPSPFSHHTHTNTYTHIDAYDDWKAYRFAVQEAELELKNKITINGRTLATTWLRLGRRSGVLFRCKLTPLRFKNSSSWYSPSLCTTWSAVPTKNKILQKKNKNLKKYIYISKEGRKKTHPLAVQELIELVFAEPLHHLERRALVSNHIDVRSRRNQHTQRLRIGVPRGHVDRRQTLRTSKRHI